MPEEEGAGSLIIDTRAVLHQEVYEWWLKDMQNYVATRRVPKTRAERLIDASAHRGGSNARTEGDIVLDQVQRLFHSGMDVHWSPVQVKIFNVFVETCLPKIYGDSWPEHQTRVLRSRKLKRLQQEALVNMARRNGKTFVTAGTAAALLLVVPEISVAVFSTGERTARMLMDQVKNMIEKAFAAGTVVKRNDFNVVQSNKEVLLFEGPDGTKRQLGCYPGSVRVSFFFFLLFFFIGVWCVFFEWLPVLRLRA